VVAKVVVTVPVFLFMPVPPLAPGNMGDTWALFWANVEFNGIVETEDGGFEVICCR
jgi:hypothetical protein